MNIENNISSINSSQTLLNKSAHNIANVNNTSKETQTDLAKELTEQILIQNSVESNVSAIKVQDDILGSLLDIKV